MTGRYMRSHAEHGNEGVCDLAELSTAEAKIKTFQNAIFFNKNSLFW
jgi:hypothetical protein